VEPQEDLFVCYTGIARSGFKSLDEGAKSPTRRPAARKGMQEDNVSST
jgi:cold shock CspA family protein